jgi:hypothetical protein
MREPLDEARRRSAHRATWRASSAAADQAIERRCARSAGRPAYANRGEDPQRIVESNRGSSAAVAGNAGCIARVPRKRVAPADDTNVYPHGLSTRCSRIASLSGARVRSRTPSMHGPPTHRSFGTIFGTSREIVARIRSSRLSYLSVKEGRNLQALPGVARPGLEPGTPRFQGVVAGDALPRNACKSAPLRATAPLSMHGVRRGLVRVWDFVGGPKSQSLCGRPQLHPNGTRVIAARDTGRVAPHRWDVRLSTWSRQACALAGRRLARRVDRDPPSHTYEPDLRPGLFTGSCADASRAVSTRGGGCGDHRPRPTEDDEE